MKNFEELMNGISESSDMKTESLELPKEFSETKEFSESVPETSEHAETLKEMMASGNIQMSWTKVNTSNWCGCNNACFHSCFNIG